MGGYNSGGGRFAPKTDSFLKLDIAKLKQLGFLLPGRKRMLTWSRNGEPVASIGVTYLFDRIQLDYRSRSPGDDWETISDVIPLDVTHPHFGGSRDWFVCPACRRRKRVLYGDRLYRCRQCYRAVYPSQYEPDFGRALDKAQNIRDRLGGSLCIDDPFPPKPKWMRWRTYEKLRAEDERLERVWTVGIASRFRLWR